MGRLEERFVARAQGEPELQKLSKEVLSRSRLPSLRDFILRIRLCSGQDGHAGQVANLNRQRVYMTSRDLAEPTDGQDLKSYYIERVQRPASGLKLETMNFKLEDDAVLFTSTDLSSGVCLISGIDIERSVENLAHEMVHFARSRHSHGVPDLLKYAGFSEYALKRVQEPGDEVDAYLLEFGLRIRREGRHFMKLSPSSIKLHGTFDDQGKFLYRRDYLAGVVLHDMSYLHKIIRPEYEGFIDLQLKRELERKKFNEELLKNRREQKASLQQEEERRLSGLNMVWPAYRSETKSIKSLLQAAQASITRLELELGRWKLRCSQLKARSRRPAALTCE